MECLNNAVCACVRLWSVILLLLLFSSAATTRTLQCSRPKISFNPEANARLTAVLSLRNDDTSLPVCSGQVSSFAIQNIAILHWAVDKFNKAKYVYGIDIGLDVYDDCGSERYSVGSVLEAIGDVPVSASEQCILYNSTVLHIGIIGSSTSHTTKAILNILTGTNTFVISPFATAPKLAETTDHFYRTVPSDIQQAQAIVEVLKQLKWTYIAVVYTTEKIESVTYMKEIAKSEGICIEKMIEIETTDSNEDFTDNTVRDLLLSQRTMVKDNHLGVVYFGVKEIAKKLLWYLNKEARSDNNLKHMYWLMSDAVGTQRDVFDELNIIGNRTFTLSPYSIQVNEAKEFLTQKWQNALKPAENGTADELEELIACTGETSVPDWDPSNVLSLIDAVYVYGSALGRKQRVHCSQTQGVCTALKENFVPDVREFPLNYSSLEQSISIPEFAEANRTVAFTTEGDLIPDNNVPLYTVNQYINDINGENGHFTKVAEFVDGSLTIDTPSAFTDHPTSECGQSCPHCIKTVSTPYAFIDGDAIIVGMFRLHITDPKNPFECGDIHTDSFDIFRMEAFLYYVEMLSNQTDFTVGALVLDDCSSSVRAVKIVSDLMSGRMVTDMNGNTTIDVNNIVAFMPDIFSDSTIAVAQLLTKLNIPTISPSASSPDLDDRINFPYFLRTVPSDTMQALAMVKIIERMKWKYVSALYVKNNYGSKGIDNFLRFANASGICVAQSPIGISDISGDNQDLNRHLTTLRNQNVKVVVYFGTRERIVDVLTAMQEKYSGDNEKFDFIFLSSEDWGDNQFIIDKNEDVTKGALTFVNEVVSASHDEGFKEYLKTLAPRNMMRNPWFNIYWQQIFSCDLAWSFTNKFHNVCSDSLSLNQSTINDISTSHRVLQTISATKAIIYGLVDAKNAVCKYENFPCVNYFGNMETVMEYMRNVTLVENDSTRRAFRDNGNGNYGFRILNVQRNLPQGNPHYTQVGTFNQDVLNLQTAKIEFYDNAGNPTNFLNGSCGNLCGHCSNGSPGNGTSIETTAPLGNASEFTISDFTLIGILAFIVLVMVIFFISLICFFKRRITDLELQLVQTKKVLSHQYREVRNQNGSAGQSINYPSLHFADNGTSGNTLSEWHEANNHLRQVPNGIVNQAYVPDNQQYHEARDHSHSQNSELSSPGSKQHSSSNGSNDRSSRSTSTPQQPNTAYRLNAANSFKRPADTTSGGQIKIQPRTQLAVPPCRPELPPREAAQRPITLADLPSPDGAGHRERGRKVRHSPRKTSSMSPVAYSTGSMEAQFGTDSNGNKTVNGMPPYMTFSAGSLHDSTDTSPTGLINVGGSMEKISRV